MDCFNDNPEFSSSSIADGNSDLYPVPSLVSTTGAAATRTSDTLVDLQSAVKSDYWDTYWPWDTTDQPGFAVGPPCSGFIENNQGKHHDHRLVDRRLTRGFQIRWPWPPHAWPRQATILSSHTHTQVTTGRKLASILRLSLYRVGAVPPPHWQSRKHQPPSRPLLTVRAFSASIPKEIRGSPAMNSPARLLERYPR